MSLMNLARLAGFLYLADAVAGGFAEYVRTSNTVAGDPAATAANVAAHSTLFQVAFAADLADLPLYLAVGVILYVVLRPVSQPMALAMLILNAVSVPIQALNMLSHAGALLIATNASFGVGGPAAVLFLLDMHRIGYLVAQVFFGGYMLPLGYLVFRSGYFPKVLGLILAAGCAGYLAGVAISLAGAGLQSGLATYFGVIGGLGELVFLLWLVIRGARVQGEVRWAA